MVSALCWKNRAISVGNLSIQSKPSVKCFGLTPNSKTGIFEQIKTAVDKDVAGLSALIRLMANISYMYLLRDIL